MFASRLPLLPQPSRVASVRSQPNLLVASVAELKAQFDEERDHRREEWEKAAAYLKAAVQKAQIEGQEELKRLSDTSLRREREQQELINKLQESKRESSLLK